MPTCPKCGGEMVLVKTVIYEGFSDLPDSPKIEIYKCLVCNPYIQ
jgi:ssDNA-binding Zn-finger/Zn-ribbon topoisomerase 1